MVYPLLTNLKTEEKEGQQPVRCEFAQNNDKIKPYDGAIRTG